MYVIEYFQKLIKAFDKERKCDKCWRFHAPLSLQTANIQQNESEDCDCVFVEVVNLNWRYNRTYSANSQFPTGTERITNVRIRFLMEDELGRNNYDEILGYSVSEGRWEKYLKPIQECITPDSLDRFCEELGYSVDILTPFQIDLIADPNIKDRNMVGIDCRIALRERL